MKIHNNNMTWLENIDQEWSLFLDRDGVINEESEGGYILQWNLFQFLEGVLDAIPVFTKKFSHIFIVTNQKGVGKGLMELNDLENIHQNMLNEIQKKGGRIDKIYYCIDIQDDSINRKPNIGMALQAKKDFPMIDFSKSIMVGNTVSDMEFGRNAGMRTIFIHSKKIISDFSKVNFDANFYSLEELAKAL